MTPDRAGRDTKDREAATEGASGPPSPRRTSSTISAVEDGRPRCRTKESTSALSASPARITFSTISVASARAPAHSCSKPGGTRVMADSLTRSWSLPDESIDTLVAVAGELPAPFGQLILCPLGGAVSRSATADIALSVVDAPWLYFCLSMWTDPAEDERNIAWARRLAASMRDIGVGTTVANFVAEDEAGRLRASYGEEKYARLAELKRRWDPDNLFRLNQNIRPARTATYAGTALGGNPAVQSPGNATGRSSHGNIQLAITGPANIRQGLLAWGTGSRCVASSGGEREQLAVLLKWLHR